MIEDVNAISAHSMLLGRLPEGRAASGGERGRDGRDSGGAGNIVLIFSGG